MSIPDLVQFGLCILISILVFGPLKMGGENLLATSSIYSAVHCQIVLKSDMLVH